MTDTKTKLLILDLDETLIHATKEPVLFNWDFEIEPYKVINRPFLKEFLNQIKKHYRIAVWSSASDDYVKKVVDHIFPKDYPLEFVWGRSKCTQQFDLQSIDDLGYSDYYNHLNYAKILKKVKKGKFAKIEDILIVDDTPKKSKYNYGNAIFPSEFTGDLKDNELVHLLNYLIQIKNEDNFRIIEKRHWKKQINN